jgi:hypothetical protein
MKSRPCHFLEVAPQAPRQQFDIASAINRSKYCQSELTLQKLGASITKNVLPDSYGLAIATTVDS